VAIMRVFDTVTLRMQRVGYLKRLIKRISVNPTNNLENIGKELVDTVTKKIRIQIDDLLAGYLKARLNGKSYPTIIKETNGWLRDGGVAPFLLLEIQDLYLANPSLPSQVGRLAKEDWRKYPQFGLILGLIRNGTYSPTTRAFSFLHLIQESELSAFTEFNTEVNPFNSSIEQSILLIYSFIENDGEILIPLWKKLRTDHSEPFTEREAGDMLPKIIKNVISRHRKGLIPVDLRKKLETLEKIADNIALQLNIKDYSSVSPREEFVRVRLEPAVDFGLLQKANSFRYEYSFSQAGGTFIDAFEGDEDSKKIGSFLQDHFFTTMATTLDISAKPMESDEVIPHLMASWNIISSSNGYAPIEEIGLLAGIKALVNENKIIEIAKARETLIAYQKANPYEVRFTVDRLGALAHAKFINSTNR